MFKFEEKFKVRERERDRENTEVKQFIILFAVVFLKVRVISIEKECVCNGVRECITVFCII